MKTISSHLKVSSRNVGKEEWQEQRNSGEKQQKKNNHNEQKQHHFICFWHLIHICKENYNKLGKRYV